jgi:hypothetical protein
MRKFINDTLKVKGKYSMKRVLVAASFPYTLGLGIYIVISDRLLGLKTVNPYAIQVFLGMLAFITGALGITAYAKKQELKDNEDINQENQ